MRFTIFALCCLQLVSLELLRDDEVVTFVKSHGYEAEAHQVTTDDGYILRLHRVVHKHGPDKSKKPVFLMHSAFSNSFYYLNTPNISVGFFFADERYDVWLGNVRGSKFSTRHKRLSPESLKFWQFSFHEMGIYDLKAMIDYTLRETGSERCFFVGHSQACTQSLVFLSMLPGYNEKIIQSHLMSPIGAMANPRFPLTNLAPLYLVGEKLLWYENFDGFGVKDGWVCGENLMVLGHLVSDQVEPSIF
jgi:pimeloyl-ACP methyl ester carboxylesterase